MCSRIQRLALLAASAALLSCADGPEVAPRQVSDSCDPGSCQDAVSWLVAAVLPRSSLGYGALDDSGTRVWYTVDVGRYVQPVGLIEDSELGDGLVAAVIAGDLSADVISLDYVGCRTEGDQVLVESCRLFQANVRIADFEVPSEAADMVFFAEQEDGALISVGPRAGDIIWWQTD